jgi:hypothetical protein
MLTILNDLHIGAQRAAGTTQTTAWELRKALLTRFAALLECTDTDLLILGDLFDTGNISMADLFEAYRMLREWLDKGHSLYLAAGNHDLQKNSTNFSSFQLLCKLLQAGPEGDQVWAIFEPTAIPYGYVIPHLPNQDIFDIALAAVPECLNLFLHCNYDNAFAVESDHSLNLSEAQAKAAPVENIFIAHEHTRSHRLSGKVQIPGNQFSSSINDCLGNTKKFMTRIDDTSFGFLPTWEAAGNYSEQDWRALEDRGEFIRVIGTATADEAAQVVSAISKFRSTAKALVITNAVQIEGCDDTEQIAANLEEINSFSVLGALLEILTPEEGVVVKKLLGDQNV